MVGVWGCTTVGKHQLCMQKAPGSIRGSISREGRDNPLPRELLPIRVLSWMDPRSEARKGTPVTLLPSLQYGFKCLHTTISLDLKRIRVAEQESYRLDPLDERAGGGEPERYRTVHREDHHKKHRKEPDDRKGAASNFSKHRRPLTHSHPSYKHPTYKWAWLGLWMYCNWFWGNAGMSKEPLQDLEMGFSVLGMVWLGESRKNDWHFSFLKAFKCRPWYSLTSAKSTDTEIPLNTIHWWLVKFFGGRGASKKR